VDKVAFIIVGWLYRSLRSLDHMVRQFIYKCSY